MGADGPTTITALVFDATTHDADCTLQTQAEQFCEPGKKLLPVMKTVALGYAETGLTLEMIGGDMTSNTGWEIETVPTVLGFVNLIEIPQ